MRFDFSISHVPGKQLLTADTLSRAPTSYTASTDDLSGDEVEAHVHMAVKSLPVTEKRLEEVRLHQEKDCVFKQIVTYCREGWPEISHLQESVKQFYAVSGELAIQEGQLMRGSRLVIPDDMRAGVLTQLHASHQEITKCRERAKQSVWWPGPSTELAEIVRKCPECVKSQVPRMEPLIPTPLPDLPWQKVATDLFEWKSVSISY